MSRIIAVASAQPEHRLDMENVRIVAERLAVHWEVRPEVVLRILENSQVETRYSVLPLDQAVTPRTFKQANDLFTIKSVELGEKAISRCLEKAGVAPSDIDLLITVSCTGVMIPSMDAVLMGRMGFRRDCKRIPITELGCAAGAVGLARAFDYVKAFPDARALVLAVELPTLTYQPQDVNMAHIVSAILFGDGAACALVANTHGGTPGPRILSTRSHLFPDSLRYMGFDVDGAGFHIVLDKCIPFVVRDTIRGILEPFVAEHGLGIDDMKFYALHPAGKKVLRFMEDRLGIKPHQSASTWEVLRTNGNMSSASVLYVLEDMMARNNFEAGDYGLILAFGPGFSAEMLLARWEA